MRRTLALLTVLTLLTTSGLALAQTESLPSRADAERDVSHEFKDTPADPNGLPPADESVPSAILDSHVSAPGGAVGVAGNTIAPYVPYNEWVLPELYPDGDGGRTKSILTPGLVRFNAMYGNWIDRDGDGVIFIANETNADNEWTYTNVEPDGTNVTQGVRAYIYPGYWPDAFSDCYILGYKYLGFDFCYLSDNSSDFDYGYVGAGEWRNSWGFFDDDGSLLGEKEVHTVANGLDTSFAPGYQCAAIDGDAAPCLVDIDVYDVLDDNVADLYGTLTTIVNDELDNLDNEVDALYDEHVGPIVDPIVDPLVNGTFDIANNATGTVFRDSFNEADPEDPYASMLGVSYADGAHAYLDITAAAYYPAPGVITISYPTFGGMPTDDGFQARGFAPHVHSYFGELYIWHDEDADTTIDAADEYYKGICEVKVDGVAQTSFNITLEPVDDLGNPTTWGTTGVYLLKSEEAAIKSGNDDVGNVSVGWLDESIVDLLDLTVDHYVLSGPITFPATCDDSDPGDFFAGTYILFPEGNRAYNIRASTDLVDVTFGDPVSGGSITETVQDIDFLERWG